MIINYRTYRRIVSEKLPEINESLKVIAGRINSVSIDELRIAIEEVCDGLTPEDIAADLLKRFDIRRKA